MAGKNDILATAGVDLSAFEAGIAKLTSRLDAVEKSGDRAGKGIKKTVEEVQKLKNIQTAQAFSSALLGIASNAGVAASAVSELNASSGIGGSSPLLKTFSAISDAAANIPGAVGIIASGVSAATAQIAQSFTVLNKYQGLARKDGISTKSAIEKEIELQKEFIAAQNTAFAAAHHLFGAQTDNERTLANMREANSSQFGLQSKKEVALIKDKTAGAAERLSLMQVEQERQQNISDLNAELQNQFSGGVMDKDALKVRDAVLNKINAEAESKKKILAVAETTEKSETDLSNIIAKRDVTLGSQLTIIEATGTAVERQLAEIEKQGLGQTKQAADLRAELNEQVLAKQNYYYINGKDLEQQKLITAQINAQAAGNKKLAALAQIRAQFELQIADAIRQGNAPKAKELANQQAAAELGVRAADIRKNPQQRAQEVKEQQAQGLAERTANARDKDIKARADAIRKSKRKDDPSLFNEKEGRFKTDDELLGRTDSTNRKSKADEKARQEFADRNEKRLLDAGKDAINKANNFQAENFIAGKIMNAP